MTVIEVKFRKAVPPLDGVAETGGRGVGPAKAVAPLTSFPPDHEHGAGFFKASESLSETLFRQRNDILSWRAWLNGFAFGVLIVSTMALIWWPHP